MKIYNVRIIKADCRLNSDISITLFQPSLEKLCEKIKESLQLDCDVSIKKRATCRVVEGLYGVYHVFKTTEQSIGNHLFDVYIASEEVDINDILDSIKTEDLFKSINERDNVGVHKLSDDEKKLFSLEKYAKFIDDNNGWVETVNGRVYMP